MSDFERAKIEIDNNISVAKKKRTSKLFQEIQQQKRQIKKEANIKDNFLAVPTLTKDILLEVNRVFFEKRGDVFAWQKTTSQHIDTEEYDIGSDFGQYGEREVSHKTRQMESRLVVPNFGDIVIFSPIEEYTEEEVKTLFGRKKRKRWAHIPENERGLYVYWTTENKSGICSKHAYQVLEIGSTRAIFIENLRAKITEAVIGAHQAKLY